jgi:hypothetical protein
MSESNVCQCGARLGIEKLQYTGESSYIEETGICVRCGPQWTKHIPLPTGTRPKKTRVPLGKTHPRPVSLEES